MDYGTIVTKCMCIIIRHVQGRFDQVIINLVYQDINFHDYSLVIDS